MAFLHRVLEPPVYGWTQNGEIDGELYIPNKREIWWAFLGRLNILENRRNWIVLVSWGATFALTLFGFVGAIYFLTLPIFLLCVFYAAVVLGTHGTVYLHRYGTHKAFEIRNRFWLFVIKNLTIKVLPEEIYIVSHLVHHGLCEKPGDPYNVKAGGMYCYFSDANHHPINRSLSESDYKKIVNAVAHTGIKVNSYSQYQKWGSVCHPFYTVLAYGFNWGLWYGIFYLLGGHALASCLFGATAFWAFGVRQFNYDGHGRGQDQRQPGIDFNWDDLSVNQLWPGYVSGEWHNNHHLYPQSARAGFLPGQIDLAWYVIRFFYAIGAISKYHDHKDRFYRDHYLPYLESVRQKPNGEVEASLALQSSLPVEKCETVAEASR